MRRADTAQAALYAAGSERLDCLPSMHRISRLDNPIRTYPWGSRTVIARLLGEAVPSREPQAELWVGAYDLESSTVRTDHHLLSLAELIARDPAAILGPKVAAGFDARLPFLLKFLAVEQPLSIQTHPDLAQARAGFETENRQGVDRASPLRNYRDRNHKPEILYAVERFSLLRGFRPVREILTSFDRLGLGEAVAGLDQLARQPGARSLCAVFCGLLGLEAGAARALVERACAAVRQRAGTTAIERWILRLAEFHPGDVGALAPLFLNLLELMPGQAVFTRPGVLHAYLEGVGIELMANSDNVVRGALTLKPRDLEELARIGCFEPTPPELISGRERRPGEHCYETPVADFLLSRLEVGGRIAFESGHERGVEILLCTAGEGRLYEAGSRCEIAVRRGDSFLVPAAVPSYRLEGRATVFRAGVGRLGDAGTAC